MVVSSVHNTLSVIFAEADSFDQFQIFPSSTYVCSYELLQHYFRKKILSVKMSDIENRPPTSVLATTTGPKDSNVKSKENIVKSKVK